MSTFMPPKTHLYAEHQLYSINSSQLISMNYQIAERRLTVLHISAVQPPEASGESMPLLLDVSRPDLTSSFLSYRCS